MSHNLVRLSPGVEDDPNWLAPALLPWHDFQHSVLVRRKAVRIAGAPKLSPCSRVAGLKVKVGGSPSGSAMGMFLLTQNAEGLYTQFLKRKPSPTVREQFNKLKALAVESKTYADRWCDDAVRQVLLDIEPTGGRAAKRFYQRLSPGHVKRRHFSRIVRRNLMMYGDYDPKSCSRALRRALYFRQRAARQNLVYYHQGH